MRASFLFFFFFFISSIGFSQNIIPNGSFEEFTKCPTRFSSEGLSTWYSPTLGTPDYFNTCSKNNCGIPENWTGSSLSKSGKAYMGLVLLSNLPNSAESYRINNSREYFQVKLLKPLEKGESYCFTMYLKPSTLSHYNVDQVGVHFSKEKVKAQGFDQIIVKPQLNNNNQIIQGNKWTKFCSTFKAKGGEEYLTLGNFEYATKTRYKGVMIPKDQRKEYMEGLAYYLFDDLSLTKSVKSAACTCVIPVRPKAKKLITTKIVPINIMVSANANGMANHKASVFKELVHL